MTVYVVTADTAPTRTYRATSAANAAALYAADHGDARQVCATEQTWDDLAAAFNDRAAAAGVPARVEGRAIVHATDGRTLQPVSTPDHLFLLTSQIPA